MVENFTRFKRISRKLRKVKKVLCKSFLGEKKIKITNFIYIEYQDQHKFFKLVGNSFL